MGAACETLCSGGTVTHTIEGSRIGRYDSNYDTSQNLKITIPKVPYCMTATAFQNSIDIFSSFVNKTLLCQVFASMDESGDGELDYKEFVTVSGEPDSFL